MNYDLSPVEPPDIPFDTNHPYGNVTEDALDEARKCYATAVLFLDTSVEYQPVINLLDRALQLVPDLLDAYYLREEVWHSFLKDSKNTGNHNDVYNSYLRSKAWEDKRTQVLKRDGSRCVCCNTQAVDVHHKTYENIGKEPLSDLASMCKSCHNATHERLQSSSQAQQFFDRVYEQTKERASNAPPIPTDPTITAI